MNANPGSQKFPSSSEEQALEGARDARIQSQPNAYAFVQQLLTRDPFLSYIRETDDLYYVRHEADPDLQVHKNRSLPEPFPPKRPELLNKAYRWLWLACLGLIIAGIGAMLFATLAAAAVLGLNFQPISKADRIRSLVVLLISGALWLGGLLLGVILLLHIL
jgi:sterol desaturase/sphingolipid hydroxylase (fatty acid hydroxylase superfamily)